MLKKINVKVKLARNVDDIYNSEKLILPGVGAFDNGVKALKKEGFYDAIKSKMDYSKVPLLGICLGMQLLANSSEEGCLKGLGLIQGEVKKFNFIDNQGLKVPHMSWNKINLKKNCNLTQFLDKDPRFYFVHSYFFDPFDKNNILATTNYGIEFASIIKKGNIYGTQFHPEKSHKYGMKLLSNFARL